MTKTPEEMAREYVEATTTEQNARQKALAAVQEWFDSIEWTEETGKPFRYKDSEDVLYHHGETIRTALKSQASSWRTIDTCPDDGTIVLLAWKNTTKSHVFNNAHMPDWEMEARSYCIHGTHGARSYHGQATHWMPLPSPPTQTSMDGEG